MTDRNQAEELRRRYRYRSLVLRGKLRVRLDAARKLVGPDCAYHLYRSVTSKDWRDERADEDVADR